MSWKVGDLRVESYWVRKEGRSSSEGEPRFPLFVLKSALARFVCGVRLET